LTELVTEICGDFANRSPLGRSRVQGAGVHGSAPVRSECQSSGPGTLTIRLGEVRR
jgi:hypothetical protein